MLPLPLLFERFAALAILTGVTFLGGLPVLSWSRCRLGWASAIPLGVAFWSFCLFAFPFDGGLYVAAALLVGLNLGAWIVTRGRLARTRHGDRIANLILAVGCLPFVTVLAFQCVPPGGDASMYSTAARLIAYHGGLPYTYAPFLPTLNFSCVNNGLAANAAVATWFGVSPAAATLASEPLTYACFIFGCFAMLRRWIEPRPAAFLAVASLWASRAAQMIVYWGGIPNLMAVAMGFFAIRLMLDMPRRGSSRTFLPLGILVGAMPLVHGIGAASWLYVAAPVVAIVALLSTTHQRRTLLRFAGAAAIGGFIVLVYLVAERPTFDAPGLALTKELVEAEAPTGPLSRLWLNSISYVCNVGGSTYFLYLGWLAIGVLLVRREWRPALALLAVQACLTLAIANSRLFLLPGGLLLYAGRVSVLGSPIAAVALAFAWRSVRSDPRLRWGLAMPIAVLVLVLAVDRHGRAYQQLACRPHMSVETFHAIEWAGKNLDPRETYIVDADNRCSIYIPSVAGLASANFQMHHMMAVTYWKQATVPTPTHVIFARHERRVDPPQGTMVYSNDEVAIVKLEPPPVSAVQAVPVGYERKQ